VTAPLAAPPAAPRDGCAEGEPFRKRRPPPRPFDIKNYPQRLVAIEIFYAGWGYHGFASQGCAAAHREERTGFCIAPAAPDARSHSHGADAAETVETHLFLALRATRLIAPEATWAECEYSRCGRTDKGVSALRQARDARKQAVPSV
jgi:tRNA pseudouridine38/39 synthase